MPKRPKKSKYKHTVIKNKKYYFYKVTWKDITGDAGHATADEFVFRLLPRFWHIHLIL